MNKAPTTLIIMDGFGLTGPGPGNAVSLAQTPQLDRLFAEYAHTTLSASGLDVGLPAGQMGNSDVGQRVNFGCGTVTTNYDGHKKFRCTIGDDVFLGCNTNLIAPVTVGDRAYTAAGSTVTDDVPDGALAIARARQTNKPGWADRLHSLWKKDK